MKMSCISHWSCSLHRPVLAICLLIVLTVSVGGCQTANQTSPSLSTTDTADAAHDFGSLVVGLQGGTVWLLLEDETPQLLTHGFSPQISPDGHWVLVGHHPERDPPWPVYWLIDTHDHTEQPLLSPVEGHAYHMYDRAWSPDSTQVAFTCGGYGKMYYSGDLRLVDVASGKVTQIAERNAGEPHFSPDGQWIATTTPEIGYSHGSVALWHVESKSSPFLVTPLSMSFLEWADDSSGFAVAYQRLEGTGYSLELWWIPVEGDPVQFSRHLSNVSSVVWQPGAERLAYSLARVHLANRNGSRDRGIPGSLGMKVSSWSPDGHWLLLTDHNNHPYIVDALALRAPISLSMDHVHGWAGAMHYLASTYREDIAELYLCAPPETCQLLAQFEDWIQSVSYTEQVYRP